MFADQVETFLRTMTIRTGAPATVVSSGSHHSLRQVDTRALHEMIEMLSLIEEEM